MQYVSYDALSGSRRHAYAQPDVYRICLAPFVGGRHGTQPTASCPASAVRLWVDSARKTVDVDTVGPHAENGFPTYALTLSSEAYPAAHAPPHGAHAPRASSWYCPAGHSRQPRFAAVQLAYGTVRCTLPPQSHGTRCAAIHADRSAGASCATS